MKKIINRILAGMFILTFPILVIGRASFVTVKYFFDCIKNYNYSYDLNTAWEMLKTGDINAYKNKQHEEYLKRLKKNWN